MEEDEVNRPIARKVLADRTIYYSRPMPLCTGSPVLSDLGEARLGFKKHSGDIMPGIYRAPEVILEMDWDQKVDIWSVGNMVRYTSDLQSIASTQADRHIIKGLGSSGRPSPVFRKAKRLS